MPAIKHNGHLYQIVRDWAFDEKLAYRELGNDHIEVLTIFVSEVQTVKVHAGFLEIILEHREFNQEIETSEQQQFFNKSMEGRVSA